MTARRLPDPLAVLAVSSDERRHAPTRALLERLPGARPRVEWVTTPEAALDCLNGHDVVLVDQELDGVTGLEIAERILARIPDAPVLLLAATPDSAADLEAADAGVSDFLVLSELTPLALERAIRYAISHQRALRSLAESEERLALAMQGANEGLWDWSVRSDRLYLSPRWKSMLGYGEQELTGGRVEWLALVHPDDRAALAQALEAHLAGASDHFEFEHRIRHRDGSDRWMLTRGTAVRDAQGRAVRVVGSQTDVTDRKEAERRLQHDAMHDSLTGLPNRVLFLDRLDQSILRAQRRAPEPCAAVLFLDLDRFKVVNDSLGHAVGDRLLVAVAERLEATLRPNDTVARLGGDEFTLLLDEVSDAREATRVAERVLQTLKAPFELDGRELFVDGSIGIALATADAAPQEVMRDADVAMYRAKAEGGARHAVFDGRMHEQVMRRLDMEGDLRRAIERHELAVAYQPIVQAATGRVVGFEALCRWQNGDAGFVEPAEFVSIAEETGLVVPLGRSVLEAACVELERWRAQPRGGGLTMGINVAGRQLADPDFVAMLREVIGSTGVEPRALRLEIKEHDLSRDPEGTHEILERVCDELGVRAQIDHFGTGGSSLQVLHRFPGDAVKVWRGLVLGMGRDAGAFEIVKALVGLAHNLGLEVIAEGVETREQLDYLRVIGCEFAQGFHIGAPVSAREAGALLAPGLPAR